jgi:hypothetical protein
MKVRKEAEKEDLRMRYDPTADIAAQAHEGLETLMKTVESAKSFKGNLKGALWKTATTLIATNQALSMRPKRRRATKATVEKRSSSATKSPA